MGIRKPGNAGLVTTTGGGANDLCHTLPVDPASLTVRSVIIVKILAWNPGAATTLIFGTMNRNPAGAAFVQVLPTLWAVASIDNSWMETELPNVEWQCNYTPTAALGRTGDIWVQDAGAGGVLIHIEVDEIGDYR